MYIIWYINTEDGTEDSAMLPIVAMHVRLARYPSPSEVWYSVHDKDRFENHIITESHVPPSCPKGGMLHEEGSELEGA